MIWKTFHRQSIHVILMVFLFFFQIIIFAPNTHTRTLNDGENFCIVYLTLISLDLSWKIYFSLLFFTNLILIWVLFFCDFFPSFNFWFTFVYEMNCCYCSCGCSLYRCLYMLQKRQENEKKTQCLISLLQY